MPENSIAPFSTPSAADSAHAGLNDEIDLLRAAVRRLFEIAAEAGDDAEAVRALRAMSSAAGRLAALLRTQAELGRAGDDFSQSLTRALQEIAIEMEREG